jgi:Mn2+/Fe2+ NRAMP family transporter
MAGAAIGVSHLVQSTRAGASYGYQLLVIVLLVNAFKYPFFEYGHRYAVATGENLLCGYQRLGRGFLYAFLAVNFVTSLITIAGVTLVTAGLAQNLLGDGLGATGWSALVMGICVGILVIGHYKWLDHSMKVIMAVLFVATVSAFAVALQHGPVAPGHVGPSPWDTAALGFLIALMGWMPAPVELSVFQSLWIAANEQSLGRRTTMREARFDFNFGYSLTVVLAVIFVMLGALVMYGSGVQFANTGAGFAGQLVDLYRNTLGGWAGPIIGLAALTTMFSTTLTVIDAYPRSLAVGTKLAVETRLGLRTVHSIFMAVGCVAGLVIIAVFIDRLKGLVDLATTLAFLTAPLYGYLNYRLITSDHTPQENRPGRFLRALSWLGILYFVAFGLLFIVHRFFPGLFP